MSEIFGILGQYGIMGVCVICSTWILTTYLKYRFDKKLIRLNKKHNKKNGK